MRTITEKDIRKIVVVGFLVQECEPTNGVSFVCNEPMFNFWDDTGALDLSRNCKVIGVLPAPIGSYRVYGIGDDGEKIELGYEYPGAYHPDWIDELNTRRKEN